MRRVQREHERLAVPPLRDHAGHRAGEGLRVQNVRVFCERHICGDGRQRMCDPARRILRRKPAPDDFDAIHSLFARGLRLRLRGDHGDVVTEPHEITAKIKCVGFQPADLGWKVNALLQDLHACQSVVLRSAPVSWCTTMSAIRTAAFPSPYGLAPLVICCRSVPVKSADPSCTILSWSVPTSCAMPARTPSGRSVTSRITRTGVPNVGASSWIPPESVSANVACLSALTRSM